MSESNNSRAERQKIQHIFIIGAKSVGQYGGFETFVDMLTEQHAFEPHLKYHIASKANGDGHMDESKLQNIIVTKKSANGEVIEFSYHNAHVFKIKCPPIGPATAIFYDKAAMEYCIRYCREHSIPRPVFYVLTCRIGPFIKSYARQIREIGGRFFLNPDGHEWKRAKWSMPVRKYWKWSERTMVAAADVVICDSVNIENYIIENYHHPNTRYIAYGSDTTPSKLGDENPEFTSWMNEKKLNKNEYYLVVGRFVPENNYEIMIREFMKSHTCKSFALITNVNEKYLHELENKLHFHNDGRIKFVGTVYDKELLKKIRECAFGYFHGHEVGGTNPSLLEALGHTSLNLLLDVGFNREVGADSALYWNKNRGDLAALIDKADVMDEREYKEFAVKAKNRIKDYYSWKDIADKYKSVFMNTGLIEEHNVH